ncbi:MAG: hypothetical protein HXY52_10280 [Nitrospirae bacterium]|jgi:pimeloyl-ACP methyl ester carboxylesterase|nr:hypothetical protein [Nitrospirota bacterium]
MKIRLDIIKNEGDKSKYAIVLVHGLGMDKNIWFDPSKSRILGGMFPLKILLKKYPSFKTIFHDLKKYNYPLITWSQRNPAGEIDKVVKELNEIMSIASNMTEKGIIIICHSRGGLIARKYLMNSVAPVKALITISTPHKGSSLARVSKYLSPVVSLFLQFIPEGRRNSTKSAVGKIMQFLGSKALKELLPDSKFFQSLKDFPVGGVNYFSIGGSTPTLFKLSRISFPDILEKIIPAGLCPDEFRIDKGDGLVTVESSKLLWAQAHVNFPCNHVSILFDKQVRNYIMKIIKEM